MQQNIQQPGIENNIGRLVEESLAALNEVDQRIQALRQGLVQAIPGLAQQQGGLGAMTTPFQGQFGGRVFGGQGNFGNVGAGITTAFVNTPMGPIPVVVPTAAVTPLAPGFTGNTGDISGLGVYGNPVQAPFVGSGINTAYLGGAQNLFRGVGASPFATFGSPLGVSAPFRGAPFGNLW